MIIIIFFREAFLNAAVCLAPLGVVPVASQPEGDGSTQAWVWFQSDLPLVSSPFMSIWHCLTWPCIYLTANPAFLSLGTLSFSMRNSDLLRLCWQRTLCMLELILINFYFYFILLKHILKSNPLLPFWTLRHMLLERTSQNGEFIVMHSQVSSVSMKYMCLLSYFRDFF